MPVRRDPRTGTVDVAVVDARDPHPAEEIGYWLKAPVRMVRTSIASMESALLRLATGSTRTRTPGCARSRRPSGRRRRRPSARPDAHADVRDTRRRRRARVRAAAGRSGAGHPADAPQPRHAARRERDLEAVDLRARRRSSIGPPAIERVAEPARLERRTPARRAPSRSSTCAPQRKLAAVRADAPAAPAAAEPVSIARARCASAHDRDSDPRPARRGDAHVRPPRGRARRPARRARRLDGHGRDRRPRRAPRRSPAELDADGLSRDARARASRQLVRIPMDAAHAPLLAVMRPPPRPGGRRRGLGPGRGQAVALVLADGLGDTARRDRAHRASSPAPRARRSAACCATGASVGMRRSVLKRRHPCPTTPSSASSGRRRPSRPTKPKRPRASA